MREFRSVQTWWSSRNVINACVCGAVPALVWCFMRKCTFRSWHHVGGIAEHYEKSLLRDNYSRCYLREMKIISLDWIVLLRRFLTLKWSRGVPMDPKISFRLSAQKTQNILTPLFPDSYMLITRIFWHVFEKKSCRVLRGNCVRVPMDPRWPPTGLHLTKIIFLIVVRLRLHL